MELQLIILPDFARVEHSIAVDDVALRTIDLVSVTELERHLARHASESKTPCLVGLLSGDGPCWSDVFTYISRVRPATGCALSSTSVPLYVAVIGSMRHFNISVAMNPFGEATSLLIAIDEEQRNGFGIERDFKRSVGVNHGLEGEGELTEMAAAPRRGPRVWEKAYKARRRSSIGR